MTTFTSSSIFEDQLNYGSYPGDAPLLKELGLAPFEGKHGEKLFLGKVTVVPNAEISIWVTAWPALFFNFEIHILDRGTVYEVSTGSGDLITYWPKARDLAEGRRGPETVDEMFTVTRKPANITSSPAT